MLMVWISRGHGGWALGILGLCLLPLMLAAYFDVLPEDPALAVWSLTILLFVSGVVTTVIGYYLNRGGGFWTIDATTGLEYFDKSARHSLYFIPMQYWGFLYVALAGLLFWNI